MSEPFTIDFKEFERTFFPLVEKKIPRGSADGLVDAAWEMLKDADEIAPSTPFLVGDLLGSKAVNLNVKYGSVSVDAGYNIEYAEKLHEMTKERDRRTLWSRPGSGRQWLRSKMALFKNKYMAIVAKTIDETRV